MASNRIKRTNSFSSYVSAINKDVKAIQAQANNITGVASGSITGESLSGTTELGTNTIQSSNYAEGLTGWKIDGTGVAEFSDVFVRGDINAYSGTIGYWNISNPGVERNIGSKRLFGTFIESENLGDTDIGDSTGVYVGLYRSYREPSIVISGAYRIDDVAVIVAPAHGYKNGDKVSISLTGTTSYETRSFTVVNKELTDNVAILTLSEIHSFRSGDTVVVSGVDSTFDGTYTAIDSSSSLKTIDYTVRFAKTATNVASTAVSDAEALVKRTVSETGFSFSTGPSYVRIIESDYNSFRYENTGQNIEFQYNTAFTGSALIYDENVAGLYLNDYSKALFNHGYFSNEGINYVSAQIYNLVHNPSFEYLNDSQAETPSLDGWSADTGITLEQLAIFENFAAKSTYGAKAIWGASIYTDKYIKGTVNYSLVEPSVKYGRVLYFNLDIYANPIGDAITPSGFTLSSDATSIVVTATAHGLVEGDYVYSGNTTNDYEGHLASPLNPNGDAPEDRLRRIVKVIAADTNTFTVATYNKYVGQTLSATNQTLYKINVPQFDIADVKFKLSNGQLVAISDVADDSTKAVWAADPTTRKLTLGIDEIDANVYEDVGVLQLSAGLPNLSVIKSETSQTGTYLEYYRVPYTIKLNSAKIYQKYKDLDPTGLTAKSNMSLLLPGWLKNTLGVSMLGGYSIDSVMLATQNKFFYGGSKYGSQSWYDATVKPNTPSIQSPKTWIDIDLEAQTSRISHLDNVSFSAPGFSGSLMSYPGIANENTLDSAIILYGYNDDDATGTQFSSGQYQRGALDYSGSAPIAKKLVSKPLENALIMFESDLLTSTSIYSTYTQLTSLAQYTSNETGEIASTYAASIGLYSDEENSEMTLSADTIYFTNWNAWGMSEGNRSPLQVNFEGSVDFLAKSPYDFLEVVDVVRSAPAEGETTSVWTVTLSAAVTEQVMSNLDLVNLDYTSVEQIRGDYTATRVPASLTQFTITTDNAALALLTEPLLDTVLSSTGGYIEPYQDTHPTITNEVLPADEDSGKIATTSWVKARLAAYTPGTGGSTYTAVAPLAISETDEISMTTGYVWNTDTPDFAKLWVGSATPSLAMNGDVWIQVP